MIRIMIFLCCLLATGTLRADERDLHTLLNRLDRAIENSQQYVERHEHTIAGLKTALGKAATDGRRYDLSMRLFEEYKSYVNDSAVACLQQCRQLSRHMNRPDLEGRCLSLMAFQCSTVGMYPESLNLLGRVVRGALSRQGRGDYYTACNHVYREMAYYTNIAWLRTKYAGLAEAYDDSLMAVLPHMSPAYLMNRSMRLYNAGNYAGALQMNDVWMNSVGENKRDFAVVAYYRYLIYNVQGDSVQSRYWLARSAVSDVEHAVMDQGSLWELANLLSNDGDLDRAYRYISHAWNCAMMFGTRVRSAQISPILSSIETNYRQKVHRSNRQLRLFGMAVSIMALLLLATLLYVNRQRHRLADARNDLRQINRKLEGLNRELKRTNEELDVSNRQLLDINGRMRQTNDKLNESNRVKEEYIGRFLGLCSLYVDKLEDFRKQVHKMLKNKSLDELSRLTHSAGLKEKWLEELYSNFDEIFLRLFPDFPQAFNELLRPEDRLHLTEENHMPVTLRIFALIRLGIDDSSRIAEFLHYSVNTIYNYRARVKNGAVIDREEFEARVKELSLLSSPHFPSHH